MQGLSYLHEFQNESSVISHKSQETLDLSDISRAGHFLMASILVSSVAFPWAEMICPK